MTPSLIITILAVCISLLTFVATQFGMTKSQRATYVETLEEKIEKLEARISNLEDENLRLMRKLLANGM